MQSEKGQFSGEINVLWSILHYLGSTELRTVEVVLSYPLFKKRGMSDSQRYSWKPNLINAQKASNSDNYPLFQEVRNS